MKIAKFSNNKKSIIRHSFAAIINEINIFFVINKIYLLHKSLNQISINFKKMSVSLSAQQDCK